MPRVDKLFKHKKLFNKRGEYYYDSFWLVNKVVTNTRKTFHWEGIAMHVEEYTFMGNPKP